MAKPCIFVVEDDADLREALGDTLQLAGYETELISDGRLALDLLERKEPALIISDIQMPKMDGHALLRHVKRRWPDLPVMMITAHGTIQKAVEAMREGAIDYLAKPFEAEVLVNMVGQYVRDNVQNDTMITADPKSRDVAGLARRVANSDATIMIAGESGSGKEVLAKYIHRHSPRSEKPFIAINCAAIPDNMLEATLFGYEKGAFTGAYKACPGKFELADGGTLLLDEISEMDLGLQAKLLRVLQEKEVERLGGNKLIHLDVRVLATSNRNMRKEVERGRFREDLYYRLNVFPIRLPPLRERKGDIAELGRAFVAKHIRKLTDNNTVNVKLTYPAIEKLRTHSWPGNVRELENVIQRALILCHGDEITAEDVQFEDAIQEAGDSNDFAPASKHPGTESSGNLGDELRNREFQTIIDALKAEMGNRKAVAEKLGISQRTLRYKLAKMRDSGIAIPGR